MSSDFAQNTRMLAVMGGSTQSLSLSFQLINSGDVRERILYKITNIALCSLSEQQTLTLGKYTGIKIYTVQRIAA